MVYQQFMSFFQRERENPKYNERKVEEIRQYILSCPGISKDSPSIQTALGTLEKLALPTKTSMAPNNTKRKRRVQIDSGKNSGRNKYNKTNKKNGIQITEKETRPIISQPRPKFNVFGLICRWFIFYIPMTAVFLIFISSASLQYITDEYLFPQLDLMVWDDERKLTENTYYDRTCTIDDMTAFSAEELIIPKRFSTEERVDHMMTHGMSIYSDIIRPETADKLRSYVMQRNKDMTENEAIPVIGNKQRWSFGIGANDDPIVSEALRQIATHDTLRPALEKIVGVNPAVIEMTAITSAYGASDQFWHADVVPDGSALKYSRSFVPSYSLFITLQDTSAEMGATQVCPGTYMCTNNGPQFCVENGFPVSGKHSVWKKGWGALVNQQSQHRGAAHTDPNAPHRVVFILTFAPRPEKVAERRMLGQGGSYSTRWDMWGHTLEDFKNPKRNLRQPWAMLRSLGIYKSSRSQWGWDYISVQSMRIANEDTGFTGEDLEKFIDKVSFGLPFWLQPKVHLETTWDNYLYEFVLIIKYITGAIYAISLLFYLITTVGIVIKNEKFASTPQKIRSLGNAIVPFLLFHACIALCAFGGVHQISQTQWAKDIKKERLYRPLLTRKPTAVANTKNIEVPNPSDILIGTRLSSRFLSSYNQVFDYHPGNILWQEKMSQFDMGGMKFQKLPTIVQGQLVQDIIDSLVIQQNREFFYQNESGNWEAMEIENIKKKIRDTFLCQANPMYKALNEEIEFIKSDCRFGIMHLSSLCRRFSSQHISSIKQKISLGLLSPYESINPTTNKTNPQKNFESNMKSFFANKTKKSWITSSLAELGSRGTQIKSKKSIRNLPNRQRKKQLQKFSKGDIVDAQYRGTHNEVGLLFFFLRKLHVL